MEKPIKVLLVDDHAIVRQGLKLLLTKEPGMEVVGEASDGDQAVTLCGQLSPDIVVMDIHLNNGDGILATTQILKNYPNAKVIVLSAETAPYIINKALQNGAAGYIIKQDAAEELIRAIHTVMGGRFYLCPSIATTLIKAQTFSTDAPAQPVLTERDRELLRLISSGLRNKEIAEKLNLSIKSIEANRSKLMTKLGCSSAAELVRYAVREGIAQA
jgi:two-component system response regulator NreC